MQPAGTGIAIRSLRQQFRESPCRLGEELEVRFAKRLLPLRDTLRLHRNLRDPRTVAGFQHERNEIHRVRRGGVGSVADERQCIGEDSWPDVAAKGSGAYEAVEVLLKGLEIPLPTVIEFLDKDGNPRRHIRTGLSGPFGLAGKRIVSLEPVEVVCPPLHHLPALL